MRANQLRKVHTAHDLAAESWWDEDYQAVVLGSGLKWDALSYGPRGGIRISRLDPIKVRAFVRYISPKSKMKLVRK